MEDDLLQLSGIQHFAFCPRQWALIHVEGQWRDNAHTVDGDIFHERAHSEQSTEKRGDMIITRGMRISSQSLGVSGRCDVVEFYKNEGGISLFGREGLWQPYPIEYKKGKPKEHDADELQLCCQAMCLEEMLACEIPEGSLFYGEPRRRTGVELSPQLRESVREILCQMHEYYRRGYTPKPKQAKRCGACSLADVCLPGLSKAEPVSDYLKAATEDTT